MLKGVTATTTVNDQEYQRIKKEVKRFKKAYTAIGYFTGMTALLLTKAYANEYGAKIRVTDKMRGFFRYKFGISLKKSTTTITIPPRPFMRQTFERVKKKIQKIIAHELNRIYEGKSTAKLALSRLGEWYVGEVKRTFRKGDFVENSKLTVKEKGSSKPLSNTGELRNSVTHREFGI